MEIVKIHVIFSPANNTEYLNAAAYLEAFWGFFWPALCHNNKPQLEHWTVPKHGGLKELIDQVISVVGRVPVKPATECLRGVATYPSGDQRQGRYKMTLTDLMNHHYARAVREGMMDLVLGLSDHRVKIGDIVEMLLSISFAVKDAMLAWEWLDIDEKEWPPQRLDWEMYRIEHLAFASNMEAAFDRWLQQPWHILYSALRCMVGQEWQQQHVCPVCRKSDRNTGGLHNAWAYFDGCSTKVHWSSSQRNPNKSARDYLPMLTIIYMGPGGHRQWPMSISAPLDRLSWLVLQTRPLALSSFQAAVQKNHRWSPRYCCGPKVAVAPPPPIKFLDIGTKMGCYKIGEHIPGRDDTASIFHPRFVGEGIPAANAYDRLAKRTPNGEVWCAEEAWFAHSPQHDFRVKDPQGYIWGLPLLVPTCPKKLFALGPRKKYVDIVTGTLHASSSDLLT